MGPMLSCQGRISTASPYAAERAPRRRGRQCLAPPFIDDSAAPEQKGRSVTATRPCRALLRFRVSLCLRLCHLLGGTVHSPSCVTLCIN